MSTGSVGRFIDSAANALDGNGDKLRQTFAQLSGVGRILADGSGNIVATIDNLQTFVTALRDSNDQIVLFQDRFATLTSVVDDSRSDLDAAMKNCPTSSARCSGSSRAPGTRPPNRFGCSASVTQNLVDHRMDLENVLHIAPHSIANAVNMFDPRTGAASGVFVFNNFSNPVWAICAMIGALENVTSPETGKLCAQYLGPALDTIELQQPAGSVQPVPDVESAGLHAPILRAQAAAGERRTAAPAVHRPACGIRVHGCTAMCLRRRAMGRRPAHRPGAAAHGLAACACADTAGHAAARRGAATAR